MQLRIPFGAWSPLLATFFLPKPQDPLSFLGWMLHTATFTARSKCFLPWLAQLWAHRYSNQLPPVCPLRDFIWEVTGLSAPQEKQARKPNSLQAMVEELISEHQTGTQPLWSKLPSVLYTSIFFNTSLTCLIPILPSSHFSLCERESGFSAFSTSSWGQKLQIKCWFNEGIKPNQFNFFQNITLC